MFPAQQLDGSVAMFLVTEDVLQVPKRVMLSASPLETKAQKQKQFRYPVFTLMAVELGSQPSTLVLDCLEKKRGISKRVKCHV